MPILRLVNEATLSAAVGRHADGKPSRAVTMKSTEKPKEAQ
ncbi:hypothetical protein [Rhizobium sp. P44RR-XXIV]|nr:hypothetical protein [Rhizobium sp. P44RR-XXIV]